MSNENDNGWRARREENEEEEEEADAEESENNDGFQSDPRNGLFDQVTAEDDTDEQMEDLRSSAVTEDDSFEEGEEEEEIQSARPRYQGSDQKWLELTKDDRDLATSLEDLEADDLAIHLYNVYWLKRSGRRLLHDASTATTDELRKTRKGQKWGKSRQEEGSRIEKSPKSKQWMPRATWTAWPVEYDRVPSLQERFWGWSDGQRYKNTLHSSNHGHFLRHSEDLKGHSRLRNAQKPSQSLEDCLMDQMLHQARLRLQTRSAAQRSPPPNILTAPNASPRKRQRSQDSHNDRVRQRSYSLKSSNRDTASKRISKPAKVESPRAAMMLDEEITDKKAKPVVRHIISRLETLLMHLHKSRRNHLRHDTSDSETSRSRSASASSAASSSRSRRTRMEVLNPRDWSEILGTAALMGWDTNVIRRTSARCSQIFGETMDFHFSDDQDNEKQTDDLDIYRAELTTKDGPLVVDVVPGFLTCPVPSCFAHEVPFGSPFRLNEHLKRSHGYRGRNLSGMASNYYDETHGGIRVDGYLRPIIAPRRWLAPSNNDKSMPAYVSEGNIASQEASIRSEETAIEDDDTDNRDEDLEQDLIFESESDDNEDMTKDEEDFGNDNDDDVENDGNDIHELNSDSDNGVVHEDEDEDENEEHDDSDDDDSHVNESTHSKSYSSAKLRYSTRSGVKHELKTPATGSSNDNDPAGSDENSQSDEDI